MVRSTDRGSQPPGPPHPVQPHQRLRRCRRGHGARDGGERRKGPPPRGLHDQRPGRMSMGSTPRRLLRVGGRPRRCVDDKQSWPGQAKGDAPRPEAEATGRKGGAYAAAPVRPVRALRVPRCQIRDGGLRSHAPSHAHTESGKRIGLTPKSAKRWIRKNKQRRVQRNRQQPEEQRTTGSSLFLWLLSVPLYLMLFRIWYHPEVPVVALVAFQPAGGGLPRQTEPRRWMCVEAGSKFNLPQGFLGEVRA
jgi:hypothetical protein